MLTSGGQSCTLWILEFISTAGCGAVSLTLPLRFINHDQYRTIAQHWGTGTAINGLCHFLYSNHPIGCYMRTQTDVY